MHKKAEERQLTRLSVCARFRCVCVRFRCVCVRFRCVCALQMCVCALQMCVCALQMCVCALQMCVCALQMCVCEHFSCVCVRFRCVCVRFRCVCVRFRCVCACVLQCAENFSHSARLLLQQSWAFYTLASCLRAVLISSPDMWDWTRTHAVVVMHRRTLYENVDSAKIKVPFYRYRYFTRGIDASYRHTLYRYIDESLHP